MKRVAVFFALTSSTLIAGAQPPERVPSEAAPMQMQQMQSRMSAMNETMARIHAAEEPAERQRLMQEHMRSMQQGMATMGRMMTGAMPEAGSGTETRCAVDDMRCRMDEMQAQHGAMAGRMAMMQQMMQQMTEHMMRHESAPSALPPSESSEAPNAGAPDASAPDVENHDQHH